MDILAALSLIFGVPILIAGAIEFGKGEVTGFMVMLCGCFAIYNGASYENKKRYYEHVNNDSEHQN
ncbi:hypothetical protein [Providencia huashanensis]